MGSPVYFEVTAIIVLAIMGSVLLSLNLPGWGLITTSAVLAALSLALRVKPQKLAKVAISVRDK